ncbi:MAG: DNA-directed RNA polymerase subunit omega [Clostridia bacterium]|nr:DNA-directed RNA polymerase subunit omega [Clostridia bacterium]
MIIDPPNDKLLEKVGGCKYALAIACAKRAKFDLVKKADELACSDSTAISYAAREILEGKVKVVYEND